MKLARKQFNRLLFILGATLLVGIGLAACGGGGSIGGDSDDVGTVTGGKAQGKWTLSTWPLYIDSQTVKDFDKEFGTTTNYVEDVNDNDDFFGKVQPLLADGKSGGRGAFIVTDWMAEKMHDLGYLQNIDHDALPNVEKNLVPSLASPDYDPELKYTIPWQAGMTGIIVDKTKAPDVKSINDLFDPKYKGKVSMLTEIRNTVPLVMAADGIDPREATKQDWLDTIDKLQENVDNGQIRAFYGNDYASEFASGNVIAGMGWSGDASMLESDNPNLEWRMPTEGCALWTDNFVFPVGAKNAETALEFVNFVYRPKIAAQITDYVRYFTPVKGVQDILRKEGSEVAEDPFVFPTDESLEKCFPQTVLKKEDEAEVNRAFQQVIRG